MKPKMKPALILIPLILIVVISGYFLSRKKVDLDPLATERRERIQKSTKVIDRGLGQNPNQLYAAMMNLDPGLAPETLEKMQSFENSEEKLVRAGLVFLLSSETDEKSKAIVMKLIHDPEPVVRSHMIYSARQRPSVEKVPFLEALLANPALTGSEQVQAESVLIRCLNDEHQIKTHLDSLVSKVNFESDPSLAELALLELNDLAPQDHRVLAMDKKAVEMDKNPSVQASAIRVLAKDHAHAHGVVSELPKWIHSAVPQVKRAAIEVLPVVCPSRRWEWIRDGFLTEKDFAVKSLWILAVEKLRDPESAPFLKTALEQAEKVNALTEVKSLQLALTRLQGIQVEGPCK